MKRIAGLLLASTTFLLNTASSQSPEQIAERAVREAQSSIATIPQARLEAYCFPGNQEIRVVQNNLHETYQTTTNLLVYMGWRLEAREVAWAEKAIMGALAQADPTSSQERDALTFNLKIRAPRSVPGLNPGLRWTGQSWALDLWHPQVRGLMLIVQETGTVMPPFLAAQTMVIRSRGGKNRLPWPPEWILLTRKVSPQKSERSLSLLFMRGTLQNPPLPCAVVPLEGARELPALFSFYLEKQP